MNFENFLHECNNAKTQDDFRNIYSSFKKSTKETLVKQCKSFCIFIGLVEEVTFVDAKIKDDGSEALPKTIFTLVGGKKLYLQGKHDRSHERLKSRQIIFKTTVVAFGNNTLYFRIEEILDTKSLLDILNISHLMRS